MVAEVGSLVGALVGKAMADWTDRPSMATAERIAVVFMMNSFDDLRMVGIT
jgi:hypothetical protein